MISTTASYVTNILSDFNLKSIRYALCRDLENVLPNKYLGEADIDLIIYPDDWLMARDILRSQNWFEVLHPFDNLHDFTFLYGAKRFHFFIRGKAALDICFQLVCRSTNAGEWIPLDQEIQSSVWSNRQWDTLRCCYTLSPVDECIHLLARAYFDKKLITETYQSRIISLLPMIDELTLRRRLRLVFFGAAEEVILCLKSEKLNEIIPRVSRFHDY